MSTGAFRIARQVGGRGAFAEVGVKVEDATSTRFSVDADDAVPEYHRDAAFVGVRYAHDHWLRVRTEPQRSIHVTVTHLYDNPVDTTDMSVLFAAYQATCRALAIAPDEKVCLRADGVFEFPPAPGAASPSTRC